MINNLEALKTLMKFEKPEDFYYLTILARKADDPNATKSVKVIDNYAIYSFEQLDRVMPFVIKDCEAYNARAYLYVNKRDAFKVGLEVIRLSAEYISQGNSQAIRKAYWAAVGRIRSASADKLWVVDVDTLDADFLNEVRKTIIGFSQHHIVMEVPTKKGRHFLCKPFNRQLFGQTYPQIDIHTDNPTCLYIP